MSNSFNRRNFISAVSVAGVGVALGMPKMANAAAPEKPALLGGPKAHPGAFQDGRCSTRLNKMR